MQFISTYFGITLAGSCFLQGDGIQCYVLFTFVEWSFAIGEIEFWMQILNSNGFLSIF